MKHIALDNYHITLGKVHLDLKHFIDKSHYTQYFVLVDENTKRDCLPLILDVDELKSATIIEIKSGEIHKTIYTCIDIWTKFIRSGSDRHALLINLGGGVIGDMGGFVASTYKRGIDFINIPTTLLAQVDATIGGKLGFDFQGVKNAIGLFKNPKQVIVDHIFFKSLDFRQIKSGFAEIIKHALIKDEMYWEEIRTIKDISQIEDWSGIVEKSITIKKDIVGIDPFEKGVRKILNFGHTIGHGIESYALEYDRGALLHGEAIVIGMICEMYLAVHLLGFDRQVHIDITNYLLHHFGKYLFEDKHISQIIKYMYNDKKNKGQDIRMVLIERVGQAVYDITISEAQIRAALKYYIDL